MWFSLLLAAVSGFSLSTLQTPESADVTLPLLVYAVPRYVRPRESAILRLTFQKSMTAGTEVTLIVRGAGFWDYSVPCTHISAAPENLTCSMPRFSLTGTVDIRVKFNESDPIADLPLLPLGHQMMVWDAGLRSSSPTSLPASSQTRTVQLYGYGMFQEYVAPDSKVVVSSVTTTPPINLAVEIRGQTTTRLRNNQFKFIDAGSLAIELPLTLSRGRHAFFVSVDGAKTFFSCDKCFVTLFEPSFDGSRLKLVPPSGPITGGTSVTLHGLYGMLLSTQGLQIRLVTAVADPSNPNSVIRYSSQPVPLVSSDQLEPYVVLRDKPEFHFVTPPVNTSGYYSISVGVGEYLTSVPLNFHFYSASIAELIPAGYILSRPSKNILFCGNQLPLEQTFYARYGQRLVTRAGTVIDRTTQICDSEPVLRNSVSGASLQCLSCPLPAGFQTSATVGKVLELELSANGVDFDIPLPSKEFLVSDPKVVSISPNSGPLTGQLVTVSGSGFVDVHGMTVKLVAKTATTTVVKYSDVKFVAENLVSFTIPSFWGTPDGATVNVDTWFLPTGDDSIAIQMPSYSYKTIIPVVQSFVVDSGNQYNPLVSVKGNTVTLRIKFQDSATIKVQTFNVGTAQISPNVRSLNAQSTEFAISFEVAVELSGLMVFVLQVSNAQGNSMLVDQTMLDKTVTINTEPPKIISANIFSSNLNTPTKAQFGDSVTLMLTANTPLVSVMVKGWFVGTKGIAVSEVVAQTIGGYPSAYWKLTYRLPRDYPQGAVTFSLALQDSNGNVLPNFSGTGILTGSVNLE